MKIKEFFYSREFHKFISYHWRILFEFINEETVDFLDVGTHEIYK